ncbi:DegT/DnrJ/EryC1/StrS aminotransferase family protein [Deltaproteobacteria bacterium TL4]
MVLSKAPWPYASAEEIEVVSQVLKSGKVNYWTGQEGRQFEQEFTEHCACQYAVALANGTVALEAALHALGIGAGDEVVVTSRTFIASASAIVMCRATPVMADVDPVSQNITAETVAAVLSSRTKAIIAVHLAGWPCDMDSIMALARLKGLYVIEDCAQAQGARYKNRPVGSLGDVAAFSFCQDKIMTTGGEGGMLTTNNKEIWEKVWSLKDHGKSYDAVYHREHPPGFRWLHESFGTNLRMTEMQSAIGRMILKKIPGWIETRRHYAKLLNEALMSIPALRLTLPPANIYHSYYKYYVFVQPALLNAEWDRDRIRDTICDEGIPCYNGSCSEIYLEKAFEDAGIRPEKRLTVAKEMGETSLMFLIHPTLIEEDIQETIQVIRKVMNQAS